jgi:hypothetical protein
MLWCFCLVVEEIIFLWWRHTAIRRDMMAYTWEGLASRLSADSDLCRLEVKILMEKKRRQNVKITCWRLMNWIMSFKIYSKMMIADSQLSCVYHVIYMIIVFLLYMSTGVVHSTTELAWVPCRVLHDPGRWFRIIMLPGQIFSSWTIKSLIGLAIVCHPLDMFHVAAWFWLCPHDQGLCDCVNFVGRGFKPWTEQYNFFIGPGFDS